MKLLTRKDYEVRMEVEEEICWDVVGDETCESAAAVVSGPSLRIHHIAGQRKMRPVLGPMTGGSEVHPCLRQPIDEQRRRQWSCRANE